MSQLQAESDEKNQHYGRLRRQENPDNAGQLSVE
jgi:hypothetical protein